MALPEAASGSHFLYLSTEQRHETHSEKHFHQANKVTEKNLLKSYLLFVCTFFFYEHIDREDKGAVELATL